jgi:adenylate kinase
VSKLVDGKCPACGGEVYTRSDDNEASIIKRMNFYRNDVMPVAEYYRTIVPVADIDADKSIEEVASQIESAIKSVK